MNRYTEVETEHRAELIYILTEVPKSMLEFRFEGPHIYILFAHNYKAEHDAV